MKIPKSQGNVAIDPFHNVIPRIWHNVSLKSLKKCIIHRQRSSVSLFHPPSNPPPAIFAFKRDQELRQHCFAFMHSFLPSLERLLGFSWPMKANNSSCPFVFSSSRHRWWKYFGIGYMSFSREFFAFWKTGYASKKFIWRLLDRC